jgi:5-methyltetrahydropteroyltriglutamate--homocysteine methyltransferase
VKSEWVESPDLVATRIRRALRFVAPDQLVVNPDCGLRHLTPGVARAKLAAMVAGAAMVRADLPTLLPIPSARSPAPKTALNGDATPAAATQASQADLLAKATAPAADLSDVGQ